MARAANRYPDIQLSYEPSGRLAAAPGETVVLAVALERELAGDLTPVYAPRCAWRCRAAKAMSRRANCVPAQAFWLL